MNTCRLCLLSNFADGQKAVQVVDGKAEDGRHSGLLLAHLQHPVRYLSPHARPQIRLDAPIHAVRISMDGTTRFAQDSNRLNNGYIDSTAKWKTRILRKIHTADPVGMGRKSCQYTIFLHSIQARLSAHYKTGLAACIWRNIFVFHFASDSIYNTLYYDCDSLQQLL